MIDILDMLRGGGMAMNQNRMSPGMQLASQQNPYAQDIGGQLEDFGYPPQPSPIQNDVGDPRTLSGRIQEALGAKPSNEQGMVGQLLSLRLQPTMDDISQGAVQTLFGGKPVSGQMVSDQNLTDRLTNLKSLATIQHLGSGGNSVFSTTMDAINSDPDLASLPMIDKIRLAQKGISQNMTYGSNGQVTDMTGAAQGLGNLSYGEKQGGELAQKQVDLQYNPQIAAGEANARNVSDLNYAAPQAAQAKIGAAQGEAQANLTAQAAQYPRLVQVANKLSSLGKKATYTLAGQGLNTLKRQTGIPVGPGAVARAEYISTVDNEVLPLLRQTFGAAFTAEEGNRLRVTLGDPDKDPSEKDAVLSAFINQKAAQIDTLKRQTGGQSSNIPRGGVVNFDDLPD